MSKFKYEVSSDGFIWTEVSRPLDFQYWKHDRTTHTRDMTELETAQEQIKKLQLDVVNGEMLLKQANNKREFAEQQYVHLKIWADKLICRKW